MNNMNNKELEIIVEIDESERKKENLKKNLVITIEEFIENFISKTIKKNKNSDEWDLIIDSYDLIVEMIKKENGLWRYYRRWILEEIQKKKLSRLFNTRYIDETFEKLINLYKKKGNYNLFKNFLIRFNSGAFNLTGLLNSMKYHDWIIRHELKWKNELKWQKFINEIIDLEKLEESCTEEEAKLISLLENIQKYKPNGLKKLISLVKTLDYEKLIEIEINLNKLKQWIVKDVKSDIEKNLWFRAYLKENNLIDLIYGWVLKGIEEFGVNVDEEREKAEKKLRYLINF